MGGWVGRHLKPVELPSPHIAPLSHTSPPRSLPLPGVALSLPQDLGEAVAQLAQKLSAAAAGTQRTADKVTD